MSATGRKRTFREMSDLGGKRTFGCYCCGMTDSVLAGSCLCGSFEFQVHGPLGDVRLCHCDICRRANGSAYSANSRVPLERWKVLRKDAPITEYQSSPGAWKAFCSICGSPVYSRVDWDPLTIRVRLGTLPREAQVKIVAHVWVGSSAAWDCISDELPQYARGSD